MSSDIEALAKKQASDVNYILDNSVVRDDSTLETQIIRYQPNGDSALSTRFASKGSFIEFETTGKDMININGTRFLVKGVVSYAANTHADDVAGAYTVMNMSEIFQRANIKIGGVVVGSSDFIGKQDTLIKLMFHGRDYGNSVDSNYGFYPNISLDAIGDVNATLRRPRFMPIAAGAVITRNFSFIFKPPFGILNCKKYLYNTPLKMYFERASNDDVFAKGNGAGSQIPVLTINSMEMILETIKPELSVKMDYEKQLINGYTLQFREAFMERYAIAANAGAASSHRQLLTNLSAKPEMIFIGFQHQTRTAALTAGATAKTDPSVYDCLPITDIALNINGAKRIPYQRQELDYTTGINTYSLAYDDLVRAIGVNNKPDGGCIINYENFKTLYNIYAFDLRNNSNSGIPELNQDSTRIELEINFNAAVTLSHMYVMYLFNNTVKIIGGPNGVTIPQVVYGSVGR